jgi:phage tail-like protein
MASKNNGLHLPGQFNSYPKGPKPTHYSPHAQPKVSSHGVTPGRHGGQPTISAFSPTAGVHHNISPFQAPTPAPKHKISPMAHPAHTPHGKLRTVDDARKSLPARNPAMHGHFTQPTQLPADADPMGNYYFSLEIKVDNGSPTEVAHFRECSGLKTSSEVFEILEGGLNGRTHRRPAQSKWENLVIKYASSSSAFLMTWRDQFLQDKFDNRIKYSGAISLKNNHGDVVRKFEFTNAWPVSWEGPTFNAGGSDLAVETLEIAHEGLKITTPATPTAL